MDNDGALLEVLRNTYKGLRFRWKYRGLIILPAEQGNAAAADAIRAGQPFLFGRCGATEMRTVAEYLTGKYTEKTRGEINTLSGVFPTDDKALNRFCKLYTSCAQGADLLALWDVGAERQVIDGCHGTRFTQLRALEPYYYANPWSAALAGKHVLVVHPFADTIRAQYQKRGELCTNAPGGVNTLPELASLTVIPAVQGLAGQKTGYDTWFDALAAMEKQMDAGFELAEMDLQLRGPGDLSGTLQSGLAFDLKIASLGKDGQILTLARDAAERVLAADPELANPQNKLLCELAAKYVSKKETDFSMIS